MREDPLYNIISSDSDRKFGPYTLAEIADMVASHEVSWETWCLRVGDGEMVSVAELFPVKDTEASISSNECLEALDDSLEGDDSEVENDEEVSDQISWEDGIWYAGEDADAGQTTNEGHADEPLMDSDEVIIRLHPSIFGYPKLLWLVVIGAAVAAGTLLLTGVVSIEKPMKMVAWAAGMSSVGLVFLLLVIRMFDNYYVTRSRVEVVSGIIAKSSKEVRVSDVRRIDVAERGLLGLLNVGDVLLSSAGTGGFDVEFRYVKGAHGIKKVIRRVQKNPEAPKRFLITGSKRWLR